MLSCYTCYETVRIILADIYWAGTLRYSLRSYMIVFTQSTVILHKYLKDELRLLCYNFFESYTEFPEFSTFRKMPKYSKFSSFVAILQSVLKYSGLHDLSVKRGVSRSIYTT